MNACCARPLALLRTSAAWLLLFSFAGLVAAQTSPSDQTCRIAYQLSMTRPASHLFEVGMSVETPTPVEYVDLQMPKWSPGRYAVFNFAANVQGVRAASVCPPVVKCEAVELPVVRIDDQTWRVQMKEGPHAFKVSYKVFGDDLSGTFSQLDERHANFNGGSIFMYIVGHKPDPVSLEIAPPKNWRIVNGRMERDGQRLWQFSNYDLLIDAPTEIGPDWTSDQFKVDGQTYRVVIHSFKDEAGKRASLVRDIEKIVRAETRMWGAPEFDSYTFLIHLGNGKPGDGMEHLTSTQIISRLGLAEEGGYEGVLGTAAHEFFHVWNVKRLRPVELGPWDFTRPLNTRGLWVAEGITNYYGHLMQRRADLWSDRQLWRKLADEIARIENAPGRLLMSAEDASLAAPFLDGARFTQQTNLDQTAISYYDKGEVIGLTLDLLIRGRTHGRKSLDDVMRRMYEEFYLQSPKATYYLRGRGYTTDDFARVASEVAGIDLTDFFAQHVRGVQTLPYDEALAQVGLRLMKTPATGSTSTERFDYRIEEAKDATTQQRASRAAWMKGKG